MDNSRFFGEAVTQAFNGSTDPVDLKGGYATIVIYADTVFNSIVVGFPNANSVALDGITFPAGSTIYGVRSYEVASGTGVAYHSGVI